MSLLYLLGCKQQFSFNLEGLVMTVISDVRSFQELIGAPAGKLHTGRSRNDQVCLFYDIKAVMTEFLFGVAACV